MEDLADITQVKRVVRLIWSGLQTSLYTSINNFGSLDKFVQSTFDVLIEALEEAAQNLAEDHGNGLRVEICVGKEVVVALETRCDG